MGVPRRHELLEGRFHRPRQRTLRAAAQVDLLIEDGELFAKRRDAIVRGGLAQHFWHSSVVPRAMISRKSSPFIDSVIRELTRLGIPKHGEDCLNLAQG